MVPIVSVVGKSDMGKTTLLEKLLPELKRRGYRVATVKHDAHSFDIDHPGKDTWRHAQAGSDVVVISSATKLAMISKTNGEKTLDQIADLITDVDLILTEGYRRADKAKIEVFRSERGEKELLCTAEELIAIASDTVFDLGVPCFGLDDAAGLVDVIEEKFLLKKGKNVV